MVWEIRPYVAYALLLAPHDDERAAELFLELLAETLHLEIRSAGVGIGRGDDGERDALGRCRRLEPCDKTLVGHIGGLGEREQRRKLADLLPLGLRDHHGIAIRAHDLVADAVMEARDEGRLELLLLRHAVERRVVDDEGGVSRVLVIVDDLARIVQPCGNGQEVARTLRSAVQASQLVEEAQGEIVDAP